MPKYLTPQEVADRFRLTTKTLGQWRYRGEGPRYVKLGGSVRYELREIEAFEKRARSDADHEYDRPWNAWMTR